MKLMKLPNGTFVDPHDVRSVTPLTSGHGFPSRVIVWHGNGLCSRIDAESDQDAERLANSIATEINALTACHQINR